VECSTSQKTNHTFGNPFKLGSSKAPKSISDGEDVALDILPLKPLHKPRTLSLIRDKKSLIPVLTPHSTKVLTPHSTKMKKMNNVMADEMDEFGNMQRNVANKRRHVPLKQYKTPPNSAVSPVIVNLDPSTPLSNFGTNFAPSPISNNVASAPNLSKPRAPTPPLPAMNKFPTPVNNVPNPRPPPPVPAPKLPETKPAKDKSKPVTPFPNWFLNTQSSDIAAAIGSGNDEASTEPPSKKQRQDMLVKENHNVTVNPSMKESFLKLSDTEAFIDKNKIKDTFGGELNGDSHLQTRKEEEVRPKSRNKAVSQDDLRRDNKRLKDAISKELRKPGKNYDQLFLHLNNVRGGTEVKRKLSEEVISDALKFKKKNLVEQLKAWQKKLPNR